MKITFHIGVYFDFQYFGMYGYAYVFFATEICVLILAVV
jgi:hypothetical protein